MTIGSLYVSLLILFGCAFSLTQALIPHCGHTATTITFRPSKEADGDKRLFLLYIPSVVCNKEALQALLAKSEGFRRVSLYKEQISVPILLTLHGYSDKPLTQIEKWRSYADQNAMVIVAPRGYSLRASWNAIHCCGDALKDNVDDVGFITKVLELTSLV